MDWKRSKRYVALFLGAVIVLVCVSLLIWNRHQPRPASPPQISDSAHPAVESSQANGSPAVIEPAHTVERAQTAESSYGAAPVHEPKSEGSHSPEMPQQKAEQNIQGTVWYDQAHTKPAADVFVTGRNTKSRHNRTAAKTDATGRFLLPIYLPNTSYAVFAEDEETGLVSVDYPIISVEKGKSVENVDLVLEKGVGSVSGHVFSEDHTYSPERVTQATFYDLKPEDTEKSTKQPLAGVKITLTAQGKFPFERVAETDEQGSYQFDSLPVGPYEVMPERPAAAIIERPAMATLNPEEQKPGATYVELKNAGPMRAEGVDFTFRTDGISITGNVSDTQHRPLAGAEIVVQVSRQDPSGEGYSLGTATTVSDQTGSYRVDRLPSMDVPEARQFMFSGFPGVNYLVRAKMKGYQSVEVNVPGISQDLAQTADAMVATAVQLGVQGYQNSPDQGSLPEIQGRVISGVDLVLPIGTAVSGSFVDSYGKVLANQDIGFYPTGSNEDSDFLHLPAQATFGHTDSHGNFSFEGLPAGTYTFFAYVAHTNTYPRAMKQPLKLAAGDTVANLIVKVDTDALPPKTDNDVVF